MAKRISNKQSEHDAAVNAAGRIYRDKSKPACLNPNGEKNKSWCNFYIDVIVEIPGEDKAWVTEIETDDSVCETEAKGQWKDYDKAYSHWHLAVPSGKEANAKALLSEHSITNCSVITWKRNNDGTHTFWGLPGLA
jgi:hypothetical protein